MAKIDNEEQIALRVSQLDASELDGELLDLLKSQINKAFKYFKPGWLARFNPEVSAALRFILWKYTVNHVEATIGQQLLDLRYRNEATGSAFHWMSPRQKLLYGVFTIGLPWLQDRSGDLSRWTRRVPNIELFWKAVSWLEKFWKVAALINFLVFLREGCHQFIVERLLGIRAIFPRPQGVRQIGFEYTDRELLWHGFAEFLFFVLPLINFRRIKNMVVRHLVPTTGKETGLERTEGSYRECVVCQHWPCNPHHIGCPHVFCYYCIQGNWLADPSYTCPLCGQTVEEQASIQPVMRKVAIITK